MAMTPFWPNRQSWRGCSGKSAGWPAEAPGTFFPGPVSKPVGGKSAGNLEGVAAKGEAGRFSCWIERICHQIISLGGRRDGTEGLSGTSCRGDSVFPAQVRLSGRAGLSIILATP
jgi:hypothetical protein